jgi:excinuclease ABC subunit C
MIKEVIWRRLRHPEWGKPDLIIVDGGKPQLSSALSVTNYPVIGLAKRLETIVLRSDDDFIEINLPARSHALQLLQSLRNEAHRFANRYRTDLMKKGLNLT